MIKISKRLKKIASYVNKNSIILDVGTDHGLLPMYLVENKISKKAIASDVIPSIIEKTKIEIKRNNLEEKIYATISDGLKNIDYKKIGITPDTIIIAGMGGLLIRDILKNNFTKWSDKKLILSPHRDADILRMFLHSKNFKIIKEDIIEDGKDKFYHVIVAKKGIEKEYSTLEYMLGKNYINKSKKNNELIKYYKYLINKNNNIILKLKYSKNCDDKILELQKENKKIKEILDKENKKTK